MYTLGQATLDAIKAKITDPLILAAWSATSPQTRLLGYVGTQQEWNDSNTKQPGGALISPYSVFFVPMGGSIPTDVSISFPVDQVGNPNTLVPTGWSAPLPLSAAGVSVIDFNQLIQTATFLTAFYQIPRGLEADMAQVPHNNGLMYFATDSNKLFIYQNGWRLIAQPIPNADLGLMYGFSDALPLPSTLYLRCDGHQELISQYMDLYTVFTQLGASPYADGTEDAYHFTLPNEANTIIRAVL